MIRFIKGIFHPGLSGSVIIETASGMGFEVNIPANSSLYKNLEGEEVKVYTSMIVREDDVSLYGFSDKENLELFELLITVNGIGAKAGMSIMSALPPSELKRAIAMGDAKAISAANGVGKKTAERVILELKDKVGSFDDDILAESDVFVPASDERSEAVAALVALGYTKNEAADAVGKVKKEDLTCEEYIKNALKNLF
ncbi:Holliday junction branch migration protein RuvA [Emergencia timonensis]|uniref:Holliday junction branch migration protein RuvA n=1 Tax=Emergencia timonensis TaxID=1776384 RepID=UPI003994FA5E